MSTLSTLKKRKLEHDTNPDPNPELETSPASPTLESTSPSKYTCPGLENKEWSSPEERDAAWVRWCLESRDVYGSYVRQFMTADGMYRCPVHNDTLKLPLTDHPC